jgi:hypothetical protein
LLFIKGSKFYIKKNEAFTSIEVRLCAAAASSQNIDGLAKVLVLACYDFERGDKASV